MAARSISLGPQDADVAALKDTLHAQQELLQRLYNELDVERESSATAADESLSMILRLQGEKSAMKMEASQYKRIAEEKMYHAQETLEIFQDLIYQKEMQIASLEFQVQAYRFKLVSLGCEDLGVCEMQYPENILSRRTILGVAGDTSSQRRVKRGNSLPPFPLKDELDALSRRVSIESGQSVESTPKTVEEIKDMELGPRENPSDRDFNYWERIKKLDERVRELSHCKDLVKDVTPVSANGSSPSSSLRSPTSPASISDVIKEESPMSMKDLGHLEKKVIDKARADFGCSTSVQDIFEVPQITWQVGFQEKCRLNLGDEIVKSDVKENNWERKSSVSPGSDKSMLSPDSDKELCRSRDGATTERRLLIKHPTYAVADFELQQFNRRLKRLEDERLRPRQEISVERGDGEEVRLLREIIEKVNSIQDEIMTLRPKKPPPLEHPAMVSLQEAMLGFWL